MSCVWWALQAKDLQCLEAWNICQKEISMLQQIHKYYHIHTHTFMSVGNQSAKIATWSFTFHCSPQLSLEPESFYLLITKLYGISCSSTLGEICSRKRLIFFRSILISLYAHTCPANRRWSQNPQLSAHCYTEQEMNSHFPNHSSLWSPRKQKSSEQTVWPHSGTSCRTWARILDHKHYSVEQAAHLIIQDS